MTERSASHEVHDYSESGSEYYYRRPLGGRDLLPAVGVAIGLGLVGFYVTRVLLQRTPLVPPAGGAPPVPRPLMRRSARDG